ncbi:MAG: hypothetical protein KF832_18925 [Caldilineaceae bacterium]|nr:hypothetical protein [Caldilineaceae bacterium]
MKISFPIFLLLILWMLALGTLSCTSAYADQARWAPGSAGLQTLATADQTATAAAAIIATALAATPIPTAPVSIAATSFHGEATRTMEAQTVATAVAATVNAQSTASAQVATQTAQAQVAETIAAATRAAQATQAAIVLPTNTPACQAAPIFMAAWQRYQQQLGCPTTPLHQGAITVESFAGGYLIWIKATDRLLYTLRNRGGWSTHADTWESRMPTFACEEARHYGFPAMGFGLLWCLDTEVKRSLGAPKDREIPDDFAQMQRFEGGRIFRTRVGITFILFTDYTWVGL